MIHGQSHAVSGILRLQSPAGPGAQALRTGEAVTVRVIGRSGAGRFTVSVGGRTLEAFSELPLLPGTVLEARAERQGSAVLLRLTQPAADLARSGEGSALPGDALSQAAARALIASGLGVTAERLGLLRDAARGPAQDLHRRLRLGAELLRRLPGITADDLDAALRYVQSPDQGDEREGSERRDRRRRERQERGGISAESVREALWGGAAGGEDAPQPPEGAASASMRAVDVVRLLNHTTIDGEAWVVLPCRLTNEEGAQVDGTIRILYDTARSAVRSLVVGASVDGGAQWWFHLVPGAGGAVCRMYGDSRAPGERALALLESLRVQLGNMGVSLADTVEDGALFDGFSPAGAGAVRPVDLVG